MPIARCTRAYCLKLDFLHVNFRHPKLKWYKSCSWNGSYECFICYSFFCTRTAAFNLKNCEYKADTSTYQMEDTSHRPQKIIAAAAPPSSSVAPLAYICHRCGIPTQWNGPKFSKLEICPWQETRWRYFDSTKTLVLSKTLEIAREWNRECWISQLSTLQRANSESL